MSARVIQLIAAMAMFSIIPAFGQIPSGALRFTADGQYVLVPHTDELDSISGGLTIESWVKPDASILSRGYSSIVSKQLNGTGYMTASNLLGPAPGFKAEVAGIQVTSLSQPVVPIWQHVAAVWDGRLKIYVNGRLEGVINTGPPIPNSLPLWIGSSPFGADTNFRGAIDEVRIWAVARSQAEIQSSMNQYLCGDETGLRAYWSFDEGSGQQLTDTKGRSNGSISGPEWVPGVQLTRPPDCRSVNAQTVSFVTAKKSITGVRGFVVSSGVGDFNQDGNRDLAVTSFGSNYVSVMLGNGDGTFQTAVDFPVGGTRGSLVVSYFNGDSIQDLAVANSNGNISVLLGNGNGTFRAALDSFVGGDTGTIIDYGDFNGDHSLDLLGYTNRGNVVFLGNGNGTFRAPSYPGVGGGSLTVVGYFNDDGILDVAGPGMFGSVVVHPGNGDGTFQSGIISLGGALGPSSLAVGYFNNDAIADLAMGDFEIHATRILLGNGDGTFRRGEGIPSIIFSVVDDFNGDTIADLATRGGNVLIALGRGDGTFHKRALSFPVRGSIFVGEFNGDGIKDFAWGPGDGILVALGYGDGTFQGIWSYELGGGSSTINPDQGSTEGSTAALGEFNRDGIQDLAVVLDQNRRISVLLGNGDGSFRWAFEFATGSLSTVASLAVGEFNRDGLQDLVIGSGGSVAVFLGNGNGTFQPAVNFPAADNPAAIAVGYFNGDGFQDLAVVRRGASGISVLLGNGDGTFRAPLSFDTGVPLPGVPRKRSIAVGDFNGDGSQDLVVTNAPAASISVLLGNGDGTFRAPLISNAGGIPVALAVGDFNNDRIKDLATANNSVPGISVLLGNGNGTFRMPSSIDVGSQPDAIAVGDFNSDGILDLAAGSDNVSVLLGNGNGTFKPAVDFFVGGDSLSLAVGLLSGDGCSDIAVAGSHEVLFGSRAQNHKLSVLINDTR